jgi:hypothetical protein
VPIARVRDRESSRSPGRGRSVRSAGEIGRLRVQVQPGRTGKVKSKLAAGLDQWNTVVLPRVVAAFAGPRA